MPIVIVTLLTGRLRSIFAPWQTNVVMAGAQSTLPRAGICAFQPVGIERCSAGPRRNHRARILRGYAEFARQVDIRRRITMSACRDCDDVIGGADLGKGLRPDRARRPEATDTMNSSDEFHRV